MPSAPMKVIKDGDTVRVVPDTKVMPEMTQKEMGKEMGKDFNRFNQFNQFAQETDECIANLKRNELETAIKKQADVMKFLAEML